VHQWKELRGTGLEHRVGPAAEEFLIVAPAGDNELVSD
jgi:hypothetical protein